MGGENSKSSSGGSGQYQPQQQQQSPSYPVASNPSAGGRSFSESQRRQQQEEAGQAAASPRQPSQPQPQPQPQQQQQQQQSSSRPIAIGGGTGGHSNSNNADANSCGGGGGGPATSVPRYMDQHSMVFASPSVPFDAVGTTSSFTSRDLLSSPEAPHSGGGGGVGVSQPRPIHPTAGSGYLASSRDFTIGTPATPLSPSRRHVPSLSQPVSVPIAIPTYNSTSEDIGGVCGSPMLKSYKQHSMSFTRSSINRGGDAAVGSPTSPRVAFSASNPGMCSLGSGRNNHDSGLLGSPIAGGGFGVGSSFSGADKGGGLSATDGSAPIHQRFLEITGYPLGLENYGNTCYCNSVIQLIYHCTPLRLRLLELYDMYYSKKGGVGFEESTLLFHLASLMAVMHKSNNRKKDGKKRELISPSSLLRAVKERNIAFNNNYQQDAHEFAMFLLNDIMETESRMLTDPKNRALFSESKKKKNSGLSFWKTSTKHGGVGDGFAPSESDSPHKLFSPKKSSLSKKDAGKGIRIPDLSPIQSILQGQFGSLTACLECGNISARDEVFIDLSLETEQGSSLLTCLRRFGNPEYFYGGNKLRCDGRCGGPARAAKTIHVQRLPEYALLVHLKRFRYDVSAQNFSKKADHVALPMTMDVEEYTTDPDELNANNTTSGEGNISNEKRNGSSGNRSGGPGSGGSGGVAPDDGFVPADEATKRKLRGVARHKARFTLTGFVAHLGEGPNIGHYFTCVRYGPQLWRRFDDDNVSVMTEREVEQYFGVPINLTGVVTTTAYILLYERVA